MSRHNQEQNTDRDRRVPVSGEIWHNGRWISVDDCTNDFNQADADQEFDRLWEQYRTVDEFGTERWSDDKQREW